MGYVNFEDERYFDLRHQELAEIQTVDLDDRFCLESDSRKRIDARELKTDIDLA
jgi:hypothetical protein